MLLAVLLLNLYRDLTHVYASPQLFHMVFGNPKAVAEFCQVSNYLKILVSKDLTPNFTSIHV